jgi:GNAT superfamily N-acetyltransferase
MASESITVVRAELTADVSRALIDSLNAELSGVYSEPGATHFHLDPEEVAEGRGTFVVVYRDGSPVGCGAVRFDAEAAELKRMYVSPTERGKVWGGAFSPHSRRRRARWALGDSSSKPVSARPPPSRCIEQRASTRFRFTGNTASPRKPAYASVRTWIATLELRRVRVEWELAPRRHRRLTRMLDPGSCR